MNTNGAIDKENDHTSLDIAVIGGGIVGLHLALGLAKRNIPVTLYEQAPVLKEIGAGVGFSEGIIECMKQLDPTIVEGLSKVGIRSNAFPPWIDCSSKEDVRLRPKDKLGDMKVTFGDGFVMTACHRAQFLEELVKLMPESQVRLGKRVESIAQRGVNEKCLIKFSDGTTAEADAVIGCDGVKSRVRQTVLDKDDPAAIAHYAHESAYRCLVDMEKVAPVMGELWKQPLMYVGHGAHLMAYPVADFKYLNVAAFIHDDGEWPHGDKQTTTSSKKDVLEAFSDFGPAIQALVELLPDELNCWGMFDTLDHPLSTYAYGRIALAGDAAHGSTPHHGHGAGMGIEDALVIATLLEKATTILQSSHGSDTKSRLLEDVFKTYDSVRRERSQWLVQSSRRQGQLVKYLVPEIGNDRRKFEEDTKERLEKLLNFDRNSMLREASEEFQRRQQPASVL